MKPLDLKIEHLQRLGFRVEQRGEWLYICAIVLERRKLPGQRMCHGSMELRWRVLVLHGNPSLRRIREGLQKYFRRSGAGGPYA